MRKHFCRHLVLVVAALILSVGDSTAFAEITGVGGRFIQITKTDGTVNPGDENRFHIGEVEAFLFGITPAAGLDNANDQALSGLGAVGSTISGNPQHGADANLVNGSVTTGGSTWSRQNPLPITAQVDLGSTKSLGSFRVWQRGDGCCQDRLSSFDVSVFADDGTGNPGATIFSANHPGQVATNSFAEFTLTPTGINPGVVGAIGNDEFTGTEQNLVISNVTVLGASRVRLEQNINTPFQVAEMQLLEAGTGTNVAAASNGGIPGASSARGDTPVSRLNDGNLAGNHPNEWHSEQSPELGAWAEVTLDSPADVDTLLFNGRTDCCQNRSDDFDLILFDSGGTEIHRQNVLGAGTGSAGGTPVTIALESITSGELVADLFGLPLTIEVDADALMADSVSIANSDPSVFETVLDVTGSDINFELIAGDSSDLAGQTFTVLDVDSIIGTPGTVNISGDFDGVIADISNLFVNGTVSFAAVPEPASIGLWTLLGLVLGGFSYYRTRRKNKA